MTRLSHTPSALLALLVATGGAAADTFVGDITWTAGSVITLDDNTFIQGNLVIQEGVTIQIDAGFELVVENGGSITVLGTPSEPVLFTASGSDRWKFITFAPGSAGSMEHAIIEKTLDAAVRVDGASPTFTACEIRDVRSSLSASTALTSPAPGEVVNGGVAYGFHLFNGASAVIDACRIHDIEGGRGVSRTFRVTQPQGSNGADGTSFNQNGGGGGPGATGLTAYNAGNGGGAVGVQLNSDATALVRNSEIFDIRGGHGGSGGKGGSGGRGGDGGDGGNGGNAAPGGPSGDSGPCWAFRVDDAASRAFFVQNTVIRSRAGNTAPSAGPGTRGPGGPRGLAGSPGPGGCDGSNGSNGSQGAASNPGVPGLLGATNGLYSDAVAGIQIQAVNNIFASPTASAATALFAQNGSIIATDSNCFDGWGALNGGSGTGSLGFAFIVADPMFADAGANDFRVMPGSPVIDAGDSNQISPFGLTEDIAGLARVYDDPDTANTGVGFEPVDMGAHEFGPENPGCQFADLSEPYGVLNIFDIQSYIGLYNAQDPAADLAAPFGAFNIFDLQAFINLYNQGCP